MARALEGKACEACAIAKRRCEKQTPQCRRCKSRGIECTYPPTKPSLFCPYEGENTFSIDQDVSTFDPLLFTNPLDLGREADTGLPLGLGLSLVNSITSAQLQPDYSWFTSAKAWKVEPPPESTDDALSIRYHIQIIHRWLKQWVDKGSNPFIHTRLYRIRFPQCIQDVYMALSCYFSKTDSNELMVFRIIEDRARRLVEDSVTGSLLGTPLDTHDHLARVQALAMYQAICLYDGDIRLRHLAEGYIPVLASWIREMVDHGSRASGLGRMVMSSPYDEHTAIESDGANLLWYSWILAESIRRTSMLATSIQSFYLIQRDGTTSCFGSMMFTSRKGTWDIDSALAWEKMCSEVNVGFIQLTEAPSLLTTVAPGDVDEFAQAMLAIICGARRVNMWINR